MLIITNAWGGGTCEILVKLCLSLNKELQVLCLNLKKNRPNVLDLLQKMNPISIFCFFGFC